jgi:oligoribonuclease
MSQLRKKVTTKTINSVKIYSNLVWMDLEMSGLDPKHETILEIATVVTDNNLNILSNGPNLVIHQPKALLDNMDDWNKKHHGASGLTKKVRKSNVTLKEAEKLTLDFIKQYCKEKEAPLCGNSIAQDRRFLIKYMPKLEGWLHYRNIDVSTIKELTARWYPNKFTPPTKKGSHKALTDIKESIKELVYYRENFFTSP